MEQDSVFKQREDVLRKSFEALILQMEKEKDQRDEVFLKFLTGREEIREKHALELEMVNMDASVDTALAVFLAKVETATEGPSNWDVKGWKESIFHLTGIHPDQEARGGDPALGDGATSNEV